MLPSWIQRLYKSSKTISEAAKTTYLSISPSSSTLSHSLSVLRSPDPSPKLLRFRNSFPVVSGCRWVFAIAAVSFSPIPFGGSVSIGSVSVPLSSPLLSSRSRLRSLNLLASFSFSVAACSSLTNQLIAHHNPALKNESIAKWTL